MDWIPLIDHPPLLGAAVAIILAGIAWVVHRISGGNLMGLLSEGLFVVPMALFAGAVLILSTIVTIGVPILLGVIALHLTGGHFLVWAAFVAATLLAAWVALIDLQSI